MIMSKPICRITAVLLCMALLCTFFPATVFAADTVSYENIGIGAGGSFHSPLINPADSNNYIVFSDMNDIYYSLDAGESWGRAETTVAFLQGCFSDDGSVLYAGSNGICASYDKGQTYQYIYPREEDIVARVSHLGRNDDILYAEGYQNCYIVCMDAYQDRIYFAAMDWTTNHGLQLMGCNSDGSELVTYHTVSETGSEGPQNVNYQMIADETGLYYSDETAVYFYSFADETVSQVYTAEGLIQDLTKIGDSYFILDDLEDETKVLFTQDFETYDDLADYNTLPDYFVRFNTNFALEWHFTEISGNHMNSIFLAMTSEVDSASLIGSDYGGVIKYDGTEFHWVYDPIHQNKLTYGDNSWTTNAVYPIYGISADPNNDDHCLMTNIHSAYDLYFGEDIQDGQMQHCTVTTVDGVDYYSTTGLDCQATYSVYEDPFNNKHLLICSADIGLQISYDGGESFRRMVKDSSYSSAYNTCYDLYFDQNTEGQVYGLWSSRHNAPYSAQLSDSSAKGYFAVSYDGGINWDFTYSTGLPTNSIPVKMSVVPNGDELTIAVATFNNGFYISYDSGRTFTSISGGMDSYNGMIWGEDIVLAGDSAYCLTAWHEFDGLTPSALYKVDLATGETVQIDLGDIVIARSLTYDEEHGLYINVIPYYTYRWLEELQVNCYDNYGGGVYYCTDSGVEQILEIENGASDSIFTSDGTMYVTADKGSIYVRRNGDSAFRVYADGLFKRLKYLSLSLDETTLFATTQGGGTYRMPALQPEAAAAEYTVTFVDWDGTELAVQTVEAGAAAAAPADPAREPDADGCYVFSGWDADYSAIYCDCTITAQYEKNAHITAVTGTVDATCTQEGYSGDTRCIVCGWLVSAGELIEATGHTEAIVGATEATCTQLGYTGDSYCTVCGMMLAEGTDIAMQDHVIGYYETSEGTHNGYCGTCGALIETAACADSDDGCCDTCGCKMSQSMRFTRVRSFKNGAQYLITSNDWALDVNVGSTAVSFDTDGGFYILRETAGQGVLWTYEDGYLYTEYNGVRYYLTYTGNSSARFKPAVTDNAEDAAEWVYTNSRLRVSCADRLGRKMTRYLRIQENSVTLYTRNCAVSLYQLVE